MAMAGSVFRGIAAFALGAFVSLALLPPDHAVSGEKTVKRDEPLPFSWGQSFPDLDSYLDHLRQLGPRDIPYYERMADGRYQLMTGLNRDPSIKRIFTRAELLAKYGFTR